MSLPVSRIFLISKAMEIRRHILLIRELAIDEARLKRNVGALIMSVLCFLRI